MSAPATEFGEQYWRAFLAYVEEPGEGPLRAAYELGRSAVRRGLGVLDLATTHHEALSATLASGTDERDARALVAAAGEFFLEALSAFEMVQRILQESREAALVERRQATLLRRLSTFLGDASIALDAATSLEEMLQLVAEHARELVGAARCSARLALGEDRPTEAIAESAEHAAPGPPDAGLEGRLAAPLTALDGRRLGVIELSGKHGGSFSELDEALLVQLAQMASAAVERAQLYQA